MSIKSDVGTLSQFQATLLLLAKELPPRITLRQTVMLASILQKVAMGHDVTVAQIRAETGKDQWGKDLLGQSIGRSYDVFLEPTKHAPDNLGWVYVEENEDDRRQKFLRLTKTGEAIALKVAKALKEKP